MRGRGKLKQIAKKNTIFHEEHLIIAYTTTTQRFEGLAVFGREGDAYKAAADAREDDHINQEISQGPFLMRTGHHHYHNIVAADTYQNYQSHRS